MDGVLSTGDIDRIEENSVAGWKPEPPGPGKFNWGSTVHCMMIAEVSTIEEELALAQADSRDMKRTVIALRNELEAAHAEIHDTTLRVTQASAAEVAFNCCISL